MPLLKDDEPLLNDEVLVEPLARDDRLLYEGGAEDGGGGKFLGNEPGGKNDAGEGAVGGADWFDGGGGGVGWGVCDGAD